MLEELLISRIDHDCSQANPLEDCVSSDENFLSDIVGVVGYVTIDGNFFGYIFIVEELETCDKGLDFINCSVQNCEGESLLCEDLISFVRHYCQIACQKAIII